MLKEVTCYPPASKASMEVADLPARKNPHTHKNTMLCRIHSVVFPLYRSYLLGLSCAKLNL